MKLKIKHKLILIFIAISIIGMALISFLCYRIFVSTIEEKEKSELLAVRNAKGQEIERFFKGLQNLSLCITNEDGTVKAFRRINQAFLITRQRLTIDSIAQERLIERRDSFFYNRYQKNTKYPAYDYKSYRSFLPRNKMALLMQYSCNNLGNEFKDDMLAYSFSLKTTDTVFKSFVDHTEYGGLVMINADGDVIYTVNKSSDLGANVLKDSLSNTNLNKLFVSCMSSNQRTVVTTDFKPYFPTDHEPRAFIGCPVFYNGKKIGVIAYRLPSSTIDRIMTCENQWPENGLGNSGEVYLINKSKELRSPTRSEVEYSNRKSDKQMATNYSKEDKLVLPFSKIDSKPVREVVNGKVGTILTKNYLGTEVLSSYNRINCNGLDWYIIAEVGVEEAFSDVVELRNYILISFLVLIIIIALIANGIANLITRPVSVLSRTAKELANGNFKTPIEVKSKDELGEFAHTFHLMRLKIIDLVNNLKLSYSNLEERQKEILDSIHYAKRIQDNILADENLIRSNFKEHFILFNPKDIVSGDFYYAARESKDHSFYLAVCDSTGHGIPGAFMSLLNVTYLNEAIFMKGLTKPSEILNEVRRNLIFNLSAEDSKDGMEGAVLRFFPGNHKISYAVSFNAPIVIRNGEVIVLKNDRMPVGKSPNQNPFTEFEFELKPNDIIYLYSDGFIDQFGGADNKKFKFKRFVELLTSVWHLDLISQKERIEFVLQEWKGNNEQTDDIIVLAVKV